MTLTGFGPQALRRAFSAAAMCFLIPGEELGTPADAAVRITKACAIDESNGKFWVPTVRPDKSMRFRSKILFFAF